jgi:hypothetical protein
MVYVTYVGSILLDGVAFLLSLGPGLCPKRNGFGEKPFRQASKKGSETSFLRKGVSPAKLAKLPLTLRKGYRRRNWGFASLLSVLLKYCRHRQYKSESHVYVLLLIKLYCRRAWSPQDKSLGSPAEAAWEPPRRCWVSDTASISGSSRTAEQTPETDLHLVTT